MNISEPKLKATLKYFCQNTDPELLGKTKLMKLFYFLDFSHIKKYGAPITGDTYYRLERGPVPSAIKNLVDSVALDPENSILADTIRINRTADQYLHAIQCTEIFTEDDKDYFSDIELNTLEEVCKRFGKSTTKEIVDESHSEAAWKKTAELGKISYSLAADDADCRMTKEEIEMLTHIL